MTFAPKDGRAAWPAWHCPEHGRKLVVANDGVRCPAGCRFATSQNVVRFLARPTYADSWGVQWNRYRLTQLDSYTGAPISERRARRCLGDELWGGLDGKHVLEAGCGAGRFTEILLSRGALVTSIDLTDAVDANAETFPPNDRHRVAQADICAFPFAAQQFDVVWCLGVIQHTPIPERTMANLYEQVKPGGWLVIDHYTHSLSAYTKTAPLFRQVLKRMSPHQGMKATERLVDVFFPLHHAARRNRLAQMVVSRISPVMAYHHAYPELTPALQREWAMLDTHDSLTDWYKHYRTVAQIRRHLERLGLQDVVVGRGGNGVEARGRRPPQL